MSGAHERFPTDVGDLPDAGAPALVELSHDDTFELRIEPVAKRLGDTTVRMLAYNGSIPGPTLKVTQGSAILVDIVNCGDLETTVHWHGLRLDNPYDGTHETQAPIRFGERFSARVTFPDPGVYWYHPHIRQDYGQEMGLYGNVLVEPADPAYWPPAHREVAVTLDDILLERGEVAPFDRAHATYSAMGRFGNLMLIAGEPALSLSAKRDEVVRFDFTNTANTRVFRVGLPGARMKLVGGDSGHVEHEEIVEDVVIAPSERVVVDVLFERAGELALEHRTPGRTYTLASVGVSEERAEPPLRDAFESLRTNVDMASLRERIAPYFRAEPDKVLAFRAEMNLEATPGQGATAYTCPMHPEVVSEAPGHCPKCGMKLLPAAVVAAAGGAPEHGQGQEQEHEHQHGHGHPHEQGDAQEDVHAQEHAHGRHGGGHHAHGAGGAGADGIEWEDDMVDVNRMTSPENMIWKLIDRATGAENAAIDWRFRVGDQVKIRLLNEMAGDHPMHHPFHVHGAGRFVVLARDGVEEANLVWKDTVLVRTGETLDILLDVTNPGRWMAHCHIAEHHETGMMFSFDVAPAASG